MDKFIWFLILDCFCGGAMAQDPSTACIQQLSGEVRLQSLFKKAPLDISKGQSLEVLANQTKATVKEKIALAILVSGLDQCIELGIDWRKQNYPVSINGYVKSYQSFLRSTIANLYAGKLTFGDFAKTRDKEAAELANKITAEVQQIEEQRAGEKRHREQEAIAAEEQNRVTAQRLAEQADAQRRYEQRQAVQADESRRQDALQYLLNQRQAQPFQLQPYQMPLPKTTREGLHNTHHSVG